MATESELDRNEMLSMTAEIVSSFLSHNRVNSDELPEVINSVFNALSKSGAEPAEPERPEPAVSIKRSVTPDYIICLEDGKKLKMMKRYLKTKCGMTPEEYRARWGLPADYPMVAPAYSEQRKALAKEIGLGRKSKAAEKPAPKSRASSRKTSGTAAKAAESARKPRSRKAAATA